MCTPLQNIFLALLLHSPIARLQELAGKSLLNMLLGFKNVLLDLYLFMRATLETCIYSCLDWLYIENCTLPDVVGAVRAEQL